MRGVTLQRLQVFCAVYERSSISAAARSLGLSQPTVSRHLRDFEGVSNLTLFVLDRGRVTPTAEADALYSETRFLQDGIGRLETRIDSLRRGTGSRLSIMSVGMLLPHVVSGVIADLMEGMPGLRVSLDVTTASRQLEALRAGLVDIGVMAGRVSMLDETKIPLGEGRLVALVPEDKAGDAQTVTLERLAQLPSVDSTARGPVGRILDDEMRARGLSFEGAVLCNSLIAVPPLAHALNRAAVLDEFTAHANPQAGMTVLPIEPAIRFPIIAATLNPGGSRVAIDLVVEGIRARLRSRFGG